LEIETEELCIECKLINDSLRQNSLWRYCCRGCK